MQVQLYSQRYHISHGAEHTCGTICGYLWITCGYLGTTCGLLVGTTCGYLWGLPVTNDYVHRMHSGPSAWALQLALPASAHPQNRCARGRGLISGERMLPVAQHASSAVKQQSLVQSIPPMIMYMRCILLHSGPSAWAHPTSASAWAHPTSAPQDRCAGGGGDFWRCMQVQLSDNSPRYHE